jgi:diguanylate cyclase (GGDEF)-like protein
LISLRKHIDEYQNVSGLAHQTDSELPTEVLAEFRDMLLAIGHSGGRAVPGGAKELNNRMAELHNQLLPPVSCETLAMTNRQAQAELADWADRAFALHQENEREVREMLAGIHSAVATVGERDARYASEIGDLSGRLGRIALGNDLMQMRRLIIESARALKACVAHMTVESRTMVNRLNDQVREYRARFEEADRVSNADPLTGLSNRRAFEKHLEERIALQQPFSLISIDLDGFKDVNDGYGHPAGDDLLRQFAVELRAQFATGDLIARLGGDEFVVVTDGAFAEGEQKTERIRKWALGEYKIRRGNELVKVNIGASIGVGEWSKGETAADLVARVDEEVYRVKKPRNGRVWSRVRA